MKYDICAGIEVVGYLIGFAGVATCAFSSHIFIIITCKD